MSTTKTILFVDDESDVLAMCKRIFHKDTYIRILTASSGTKALELLERTHVEVIFVDLRMPGMGGLELLKNIRVRYPRIVRVILTGYADFATVQAALNENLVSRFVTKPVSGAEIRRIAREAFTVYQEKLKKKQYTHRLKQEKAYLEGELKGKNVQQSTLLKITESLTDKQNSDVFLRRAFYLMKQITRAESAGVYFLEKHEAGERIRLVYPEPDNEVVAPVSRKSIAGYVTLTGETLSIPDVSAISDIVPYIYDTGIDQNSAVGRGSLLAVPITSGDTVQGVIELYSRLNGKGDHGQLLTDDNKYFVTIIAQEAVRVLQYNRNIENLHNQFEEFVKVILTVCDYEGQGLAGHAFGVADLSIRIAECVNSDTAYFLDTYFSEEEQKELEYAALLHDLNKITEHSFDEKGKNGRSVLQTFYMLNTITWPSQYRRVPDFCLKHKEHLNGSGQPYGLESDQIPLQARIIGLADFFDVLTAGFVESGRIISPIDALERIGEAVERGELDRRLFSLFMENRLWEQ